MYHLKNHFALQSRQQLPCGLYLSNCNSSHFINKMFFLDCQVPLTSTRQAVISTVCASSLIMAILPADSYFCQLYSTRVCGCTQRKLPGEGNGLFLLEHSPDGDHLGGMLLWTEGWYSSPSLSLEGIPTSLTQPGEGLASPFPSLQVHAFS